MVLGLLEHGEHRLIVWITTRESGIDGPVESRAGGVQMREMVGGPGWRGKRGRRAGGFTERQASSLHRSIVNRNPPPGQALDLEGGKLNQRALHLLERVLRIDCVCGQLR